MKTIIKVDNIELFEFDNSRTFALGEVVQCYGKPHVVTSIERRKLNRIDKEEVIVTIEKKEIYDGIRVTDNDLENYSITVARNSGVKSHIIAVKNSPFENKFNKNPFDSIKGY